MEELHFIEIHTNDGNGYFVQVGENENSEVESFVSKLNEDATFLTIEDCHISPYWQSETNGTPRKIINKRLITVNKNEIKLVNYLTLNKK